MTPPLKYYKRHNCARTHRTWNAVAACVFTRAAWVCGEGPYALVSWCPHGPHDRSCTVTLWATAEEALAEMKGLICGGRCLQDHEVIDLRPIRQAAA